WRFSDFKILNFSILTNIYSIYFTLNNCTQRVISTVNPSKLDTTLDAIIAAVKTELNNKGLIKKEEVKK
ncbi:hypothetical protein, partial [Flavobacterium sp.]|uniref:hypothetical protein n=1 Tax=Flavobacterium sp. TaxID=239 RepID=UPI0037512142